MKDKHPFMRKILTSINIGLMGTSFAILLALLQVDKLDRYLTQALICCSATLPLSAYFGFALQKMEWYEISEKSLTLLKVCTFLSLGVASFGISALFSHYSSTASLVFNIMAIIAAFLFSFSLDLKDEKAANGSQANFHMKRTKMKYPQGQKVAPKRENNSNEADIGEKPID